MNQEDARLLKTHGRALGQKRAVVPVGLTRTRSTWSSCSDDALVLALLAAGASPQIMVMGPTTLWPYGMDSRPIIVTKQAAVELTVGMPVMQKLGYSEQTLFENCASAACAIHWTLRMEELVDDIDDEEGKCCATPELGTIPSLV
ncbi:hypothetical protein H257_19526 [Aphanomyces astaci]|uniref:Uncharacterized protein n=1 Tax=Aphanomyces astaci TaxID=112090 RepID=W4FA25_APHAT|nr:hypothetical protein H257_19526 [Aphanomyces astaci]ETV63548.1 hypothetical protein H257_19526 [Aphanomyces astaci]|eukprot:XP_009846968.1 hypothetical protein H257_19526 [Aphanomyces astaci]